jgi:hypothetical protein
LQISIEIFFRKVEISIQYFDVIETFKETSIDEQMVKLIDGMSHLDVNEITEFVHADNPTSKVFTEAIMDDIYEVVDMISNNHCLDEELEDEVEWQDDIINLPNNAATIIKCEQVLAKIVALGAVILHPSLVSKSHGHYGNLTVAF